MTDTNPARAPISGRPKRARTLDPIKTALEAEWMLAEKVHGSTYRQIAKDATKHFGRRFSHETCRARVLNALKERVGMAVDQLREVEAERYDLYLAKLRDGIHAGQPDAINTAMRVSSERRKLFGLDAPTKLELSGTVQHATPIDVEMAELSELLGLNDPTLAEPVTEPEPVAAENVVN